MGGRLSNTYIASANQAAAGIFGGGASPIELNLYTPASIQQGTWAVLQSAACVKGALWANSGGDGNQNDGYTCKAYLNAGTWTMDSMVMCGPSRGICTIAIDGTTVASFDHYAAGETQNNARTQAGIVVATGGLKSISFLWATKNGASTGYKNGQNYVILTQTA